MTFFYQKATQIKSSIKYYISISIPKDDISSDLNSMAHKAQTLLQQVLSIIRV